MPNPPSMHQLRRMARCVMGAGQFQAHPIACQLHGNPEALHWLTPSNQPHAVIGAACMSKNPREKGLFMCCTPRVNAVRSRRHQPLPRRRLQAAGLYRWRTSPLDLALAALSGPLIGVVLIGGIRLLAVPLTVLLGLWCAARVLLAVVRGLWLAWERGRGRY